MNELSLKINIAGREYPMKVVPEEEENVRQAARLVNDKLKGFKSQFGIDDKQDLLSMVAFDGSVTVIRKEASDNKELANVLQKVDTLNQMIEKTLKKA